MKKFWGRVGDMKAAPDGLVLATENAHKAAEFEQIISGRILLKSPRGLVFPPETGLTYEANADIKARFVGEALNALALGDESGFEVEALGGIPGVFSARFMDTADSVLQCQEILRRLDGSVNRRARFVCVLSVYDPQTKGFFRVRGECDGRVSEVRLGDGGFGYDPIFIPNGESSSFAELPTSVKNKISHRATAIEKLFGMDWEGSLSGAADRKKI